MLRLSSIAILLLSFAAIQAQRIDPKLLGGLSYRMIGPFRGGRAIAVTGVPDNPNRFYFGSVGGGVWQSDNAGRTWNPIFDGQPDASIGAIAVAPSDTNIIYVGAGEADMRNDIQQGHGMYKSTDAGKSWTRLGLEDTRQIGKILVDPKDPNIVYVAALGHQYGPNEQRGVFKTTDGGKTWSKVLYKGPDVGAICLAFDTYDSNTVYASMWHTRRPPWSYYPPSNGPGGGLFKSTDAGQTWTQIQGCGFPAFVGKVGIAVSPVDHNRVYCVVDTNDFKTGGVYRSDDAGATWTRTSSEGRLWMRGWYFGEVAADPKDVDTLYVMNTSTYRSTDGGKTFTAIKGAPGGDDNHALWIAPDDPSRMIMGTDQGVVVTVDGAKTWSTWYNQPTGQFYHVAADNRFPYWVYGAQQDSGAMAGPSRTIHTGIGALYWRPIDAGGESGTIAPDLLHPGVILDNGGSKEQLDTGWHRSFDPTLKYFDTSWRSEWTQPIASSPLDPKVFYISHQQVFESKDGGDNWQIISPDLTRPTTTNPSNLDPATIAANDGQPRRAVVYWIAPSPVRKRLVWAGTDDGLIWRTDNDGGNWHNVTPPQLTPWSKVGIIDASHFDASTAYAAIDRHRIDDNHPYIYRTENGGKTWKLIVEGIPSAQFVNVVREDPYCPNLLYAGTDWGVYVSIDRGDHWQPMQLNLPAASIRDIVVHEGDLVIATHGRALWILDNASPLRQIAAGKVHGATALFKPVVAIPFQRAGTFGFGRFDEGTPLPLDEPVGENPAWGATIDYTLADGRNPVVFTITDSKGKRVRRLASTDKLRKIDTDKLEIPAYWVKQETPIPTGAGGHRIYWDFRYRDAQGPYVPPGNYKLTVSVGGKTYSQPLVVGRDPRISASKADLEAQFELALSVGEEIERVRPALSRAQAMLKAAAPGPRKEALQRLVGPDGTGTPDEGGTAPLDRTSFKVVLRGLESLLGAIESAPAKPTADYLKAFRALKAQAQTNVARLNSLK